MEAIVCKFGGSSVADENRIRQIESIIRADKRRRYIIVSAPGKREADDQKITDLLYLCHELADQGLDMEEPFHIIRGRFLDIARGLKVGLDIEGILDEIYEQIRGGASSDLVASRGEYLNARLLADYLGGVFVEASEVVKFQAEGRIAEITYELLAAKLNEEHLYVIPGFYGSDANNKIRTFSRGGSDITGAIVARGVGASVYENWTDVSGFLMTDPGVVDNPKPMHTVTYREIRELSYMGAKVFHEEAIFPVSKAKIPINIRNTHRPADPGTMIVHKREINESIVAGIAGKPDFSLIFIEKFLMNKERGFGRRLFTILESHGISYEHAPTGIDTMSVIISDEQLQDKAEIVMDEMKRVLNPDRIELFSGLALIATVGEGMAYRPGVAAKLFTALYEAGVNVRIIDQGSSEINIIVGVKSEDYSRAVNAIYHAFC